MTLTKSKWVFASIWLGGAGLVFLILVVQSLVGRYGSQSEAAWAWYLPTVMPTLSLIIGVLATDFRIAATANATAAAGAVTTTTIATDAKILPVSARGLLWLGVGKEDFLYKPAVEFDAFLKEKGITHTPLETGGGHTWMNARHYLAETLQLYFK